MVKFFTNLNVDKSSKIGITSLLSNITTKPDSHKGGWARLLKCQLNVAGYANVTILNNKHRLSEFDNLVLDLGAEFSGVLNLFGGLDQKCYTRVCEIIHFRGRIFSWKNQVPDLTSIIHQRLRNESTFEDFQTLGDKEFKLLKDKMMIPVIDHVYPTEKLLISDSHGPGVWDPSYMIDRQDGRTLHGIIKNNTIEEVIGRNIPIKELMIQASSIDVRHHLMRQVNPERATYKMISDLGQQLFLYKQLGKLEKVTLVETMGIEDESRELPKTGYYKGTPYMGSRKERNNLRHYFNDNIKVFADAATKSGFPIDVIAYPEYFFDQEDKLQFQVMERPGSVHLSPEHYRTNLETTDFRWTNSHNINMQSKQMVIKMAGDMEKDMYES